MPDQVKDFNSTLNVNTEEPSQADEEEPTSSQSTNQDTLQELIGSVVNERRKQEAGKKTKVNNDYKKSLILTQESIEKVFHAHEVEASSVHQTHLKLLQELLVRKIKIEAAMTNELASLKTDYEAQSKDLQACIERRIAELK